MRPGFVERGRSVDARIDGLVRGRPHAPAVYFQSEAPRRHFATTSISTPGMPAHPPLFPSCSWQKTLLSILHRRTADCILLADNHCPMHPRVFSPVRLGGRVPMLDVA